MAPRAQVAALAVAGERPDHWLVIDEYGSFLGLHGERLRVTVNGEVRVERALVGLEHVLVVAHGVACSSDALRACAEHGVPVTFVSSLGKPYARVVAPELTGTVQTRRQQLLAYYDGRGVHLAKAFAMAKLRNQAVLLKYMAKYRQHTEPEVFAIAREAAFVCEDLARQVEETQGADTEAVRLPLMALEAQGARHYWDAARLLVRPDLAWPRRETRGAADLVNQLLNYGYGILYAQVEQAILLAGLDPYGGYLHEDRPGKISLVLDLIEEFRQPVVDRAVFALLNQRVAVGQDADGRLDRATRQVVVRRVQERLESPEPFRGRRPRLRTILQGQARALATYLRGDSGPYVPYVSRW
jgi:CRISPR-associated protein Cas1